MTDKRRLWSDLGPIKIHALILAPFCQDDLISSNLSDPTCEPAVIFNQSFPQLSFLTLSQSNSDFFSLFSPSSLFTKLRCRVKDEKESFRQILSMIWEIMHCILKKPNFHCCSFSGQVYCLNDAFNLKDIARSISTRHHIYTVLQHTYILANVSTFLFAICKVKI